ncbi:Uncharacterised protein [Mycobacteroides abscessus subsp. abscessus]|uniref:hypothetical protein n=1 Tax=Mycobacteroides abscessus TaxID=36809 RepID=UPI0009C50AF6|nr:hypothetical protein [Mycobacteroides abscessus]SLI19430.1 Uncharacterised protein [Mycobacteroides abscessus subsp. abscessus]
MKERKTVGSARDQLASLDVFISQRERDIKGLLLVLADLGIGEDEAWGRAKERLLADERTVTTGSAGSAQIGNTAPLSAGPMSSPPVSGSLPVAGGWIPMLGGGIPRGAGAAPTVIPPAMTNSPLPPTAWGSPIGPAAGSSPVGNSAPPPPTPSGASEFLEHLGIADAPAQTDSGNGPHSSAREQDK